MNYIDEEGFYPDQEYYYLETKAGTFRANELTNLLLMWSDYFTERCDPKYNAISVGKVGAKV